MLTEMVALGPENLSRKGLEKVQVETEHLSQGAETWDALSQLLATETAGTSKKRTPLAPN